jgi:hypothetical protein
MEISNYILALQSTTSTIKYTIRCTMNEHVRKVCSHCGCEFKGGLSTNLDEEQYI